jgi:hypothetical protein
VPGLAAYGEEARTSPVDDMACGMGLVLVVDLCSMETSDSCRELRPELRARSCSRAYLMGKLPMP